MQESLKNVEDIGVQLAKLGDHFRVTRSEYESLIHGQDPVPVLLKLREDNGTLTRHLFGDPIPSVKELADGAVRDLTAEEKDHAYSLLKGLFEYRLRDLNQMAHEAYDRYMQLHEKDAFYSESLLRQSMSERQAEKEAEALAQAEAQEQADTEEADVLPLDLHALFRVA